MTEVLECPRNKFKPCRPECALYREDTRVMDSGSVLIVKGCTDVMILDELKCINKRLSKVQAETGETKNANLFLALSLLGDGRGRNELAKMASKKQKELDDIEKVQISEVRVRPEESGRSLEDSSDPA